MNRLTRSTKYAQSKKRQKQFDNSQAGIHIVLDNIRSAFNVGSVFRTADAVGNTKIYLCGMTSDIDNPKLYKTALGATESVPSRHFSDPQEAIKHLKKSQIPIYSVELTDNAEHFQQIKYPKPVALVFGHERLGVNQLWIDESDKEVFLPMNGIKKSLNVANTASIMMYEAARKTS
jgi:23S rRNA (guanosine2251-2'-O)-methyltransferase